MHGKCELGLGMAEPIGSRWPAGQWFSMGVPQGTPGYNLIIGAQIVSGTPGRKRSPTWRIMKNL